MELKILEKHLKTLSKKDLIEMYLTKCLEFDYYVSDLRDEIKELEQTIRIKNKIIYRLKCKHKKLLDKTKGV